MNKTKTLLTAFAFFASILMLMTTTMAGPVQEKVAIDSIEQQQNELADSLESFATNMKNDREITRLSSELENDRELSYIKSMMERTNNPDQQITLLTNYINVLSEKPAYKSLKEYYTSSYSEDISSISAQSEELSKLLEQYSEDNSESDDYEICGAIPLYGAIYPVTSPDGTTQLTGSSVEIGGIDTTMSSSGCITLNTGQYTVIGGDNNYEEIWGQTEAQWAGFLRNMDGDIYIPGEGWISPDDPNYDNWLALEDALQSLGISLADIGSFLFLLGVGLIFLWQYVFIFAVLCLLPASILQSLGLTGAFWLALGNGLFDLSMIIELAAAASVLLGFLLMVLSGEISFEEP
jgi:hypothetical protein